MTETILWAHTWWGDETTDALIRRIQGAYECRLVPSPRDAREVLLLTGSKVKGTGGPFCERDPNVKVIAINLDTLILSEVTTITGVSDKNKWWLGWGGLAVPFDCGEGKTAILCAGGSGGPKTFPETLTSGAGSSLTVNSLINEPSLQTDDVLEELQCTNYMYDIVDGLAFRWGGSHASHHGISSPVDPGVFSENRDGDVSLLEKWCRWAEFITTGVLLSRASSVVFVFLCFCVFVFFFFHKYK